MVNELLLLFQLKTASRLLDHLFSIKCFNSTGIGNSPYHKNDVVTTIVILN
jgi:hypothetical protein